MKKDSLILGKEVNIKDFLLFIWGNKFFLLRAGIAGGILGIVIAFTMPVEYTAKCRLLPETSESQSQLGGLGSLASIAGISLDAGSDGALTPYIYPELAKSYSFIQEFSNIETNYVKLDTTISLYHYYSEFDSPFFLSAIVGYAVSLPYRMKELISKSEVTQIDTTIQKSEVLAISKDDLEIYDLIKSKLNVSTDRQSGIISISFETSDPFACADMTQKAANLLRDKIKIYQTKRISRNYQFLEGRWEEARDNYIKKQTELAEFNDRNKYLSSAKKQSEFQRLQFEYQLVFDIYKGLSNQLEQTRIKLAKEMPVFTVIEEPVVPVYKSKPKRTVIIAIFGFISGLFALGFLLIKKGYFS
ncbi:MAG: hypothetical protein NXI20_04890 [bacterium]|nr:hypothetical protein [bacterium]